jgi:hypothetical protein
MRVASRLSPGAKVSGGAVVAVVTFAVVIAVVIAVILGSAPANAEAAWGTFYVRSSMSSSVPSSVRPPRVVRPVGPTPPDQSWLMDIPEKPGAHSKGKVAVFVFKGDDVYQPVRAEVVRALRRKGLNVTTTLRPVDSAAQYREMSYTLNVGAYVEGELTGEGARQTAHIRLRSGVTGQPIATATFAGPTPKIIGAIGRGLWSRVGGATMRACSSKARPRKHEREPMHIDAGTPLDNTPVAAQQGT